MKSYTDMGVVSAEEYHFSESMTIKYLVESGVIVVVQEWLSHRKAGIRDETISMVEKTKEKSTEKVHFIVRAVFVPERIKRVVVSLDRQKVRNRHE